VSSTGPQDSPVWPPGPQDRSGVPQPAPTAAPTPTPPPTPNRRPRRKRRVAAAAAGVVLVAGAGTALALGGGNTVDQHATYRHEITALDIDAVGDVSVVSGAPAGSVEVTRRIRVGWGSSASSVGNETWQGSTLMVRPNCSGSCDIDYEIRVPSGVAVTAHTGSGDIELLGGLGTVTLQSGSGDVQADVATTSFTSRTGSGDMELRFRSAPDELAANSGSGDVDIRLPPFERYALETNTGSGDIALDVAQESSSSHHVQVRTGSGDISIQSH
jgi:hypothetical protein